MDRSSDSEHGEAHSYRQQVGRPNGEGPRQAGLEGPVLREAFEALMALRESTPSGVSFEPIAAAMVESVLAKALARHGVPPATQRSLSQQIARSLSDDAMAGPRLESFWDQLEAVSNGEAG